MADRGQQQQQVQQDQAKVLRIGMVKDGKVIDDRTIRAGENVTVGDSPRNTLNVAIKALPSKFTLFQVDKAGRYTLNFTDKMDGMLSVKDQLMGLEALRKGGQAKGKGGVWAYALDPKDRGRVTVENVIFLFQFVPAPLESARQLAGIDFRPRLVEEDDAVFYAFLGVFTSLAAVLMIYVYNTEPPPEPSIDDIPERFVELIVPPQDVKPPPTDEKPADEGKKADEKKAEADKKDKEPKRELTEAEKAAAEQARQQRMRDEVMKQSKLLLGILGTRGDTTSGQSVNDVFGENDQVGTTLKDSLAGVTGAEVATATMGVKGATAGGGRGDATIGELGRSGGGSSNVGSGPATKVRARSDLGAIEAVGGNGDAVKKDVAKYKGQVQYCYEQRLRENPSLAGRLQVAVSISGGRVTSVSIEENTTGDSQLETCVIGRVRTWHFPEVSENVDVYLPFALSAS